MMFLEKAMSLPEIDINISKDWIHNSKTLFGKNQNASFMGPTIDSNVIVNERITVGGYPNRIEDISKLQKFGVTKFVCLNEEYGKKPSCPSYGDKLQEDEFLHFPIKDMSIVDDEEIKTLCGKLASFVMSGEHLYIHCSGGHGRTGVVVGILLKMLYDRLTMYEIFDYIQYSHDQRRYFKYGEKMHTQQLWDPILRNKYAIGQVPTPQTSEQRYQIIRICDRE